MAAASSDGGPRGAARGGVPARRYLLATAVPRIAGHPELDTPQLADDVRRVEGLFLGELGYEKAAAVGLGPGRDELTRALRAFARSGERRPDDYLVCYIAAHGVVSPDSGAHHLLLSDSDPDDLRGSALRTEDLIAQVWEGTPLERVLLLLDACHAEAGGDDALHTALQVRRYRTPATESTGTGLALVSSSRRKEYTRPGALSAAFDRAVRSRATAGNAPASISLEHVMAAISDDPEVPDWQRPVWTVTHVSAAIPDFLPNPRYVPDTADLKLDEIDRVISLRSRERTAREAELLGHFLPRARGTDVPAEEVWDFTGRHQVLRDLAGWLASGRPADRLSVVTGDPGSGKSSVLGMAALLADPVRRAAVPLDDLPADAIPDPGAIDAAVHASHKSTRQVLDAISAAAECDAESVGALIAALQTRTAPLVVLVDSVDEALAPREVTDELLLPLLEPGLGLPLRLLVGARRHVADRLPPTALRINLDEPRYADPAAVRAYTRKLLTVPGSVLARADGARVDAVADAVATAAGRSFLVARITARTIAREVRAPDPYDQRWRDALPRLPGDAMERDLSQRLGAQAGRARDLLLPLAYSQGAGLPWAGVWPRLAAAVAGRDYGDEDIVWLREAAGSYVVESVENGGSVYRLYHRALIEYLREGRDARAVQRTITGVLRRTVEDRPDQSWQSAHPYLRRYLALHAAEGGELDALVQDAEYVLASDPGQLMSALPQLRTRPGRRAGQAVRELERLLRAQAGSGGSPEIRARLRLAALCRGARTLADSCDRARDGSALPWRARWASWNPNKGERTYPGLVAGNGAVASLAGGGGAFVGGQVRGSGVESWDLESGERTTMPGSLSGELFRRWTAVPQVGACAAVMSVDLYKDRLDPARLLSVCDRDGGITTWRLPPLLTDDNLQYPRWDPSLPEHGLFTPDRIAVGGTWGKAVVAALCFQGPRALIYALTEAPVLRGLTRRGRRDASDYELERYAERQRQRSGQLLAVYDAGAPITACAAPGAFPGGAFLFGCADGDVVRHWALVAGSEKRLRAVHQGAVRAMEVVDPHPLGRLLVSSGDDGTVRLTAFDGGEPVRTLLTAPEPVVSLAVHQADSQWLVAAATRSGTLHRIDLDSGRPIGTPLRIGPRGDVRLAAFRLGSLHCVSVQGSERGLQLYDLVSGERVGGKEYAHAASQVAEASAGLCVGGSDGIIRVWPTEHAADAYDFDAHDGPILALGEVRGPGGAPAVVTVGEDRELRCWDLERRRELWRRRLPPALLYRDRLRMCAALGGAADGRDLVVTGDAGGQCRVLVLDGGLVVAEQEFKVPDLVTAVCAGRIGGRDVVVATGGSGRIHCWDVTHGRWYAQGPGGAREPSWATGVALAPDGSGRLAVARDDGTFRLWSLPACRPLGAPVPAHQGHIGAVAFTRTPEGLRLITAGDDHRLAVWRLGGDTPAPCWEQRMPVPVCSLRTATDGVVCGDDDGDVWRLRTGRGKWEVEEAVQEVPHIATVAMASHAGREVVVSAAAVGPLWVQDAADGTLLRRLRSVCDSGLEQLVSVRWRSPGRPPRSLLFSLSDRGVLEYWDVEDPDALRTYGVPLRVPVPHGHGEDVFSVVPEESGDADALLMCGLRKGLFAVHDVAHGPLMNDWVVKRTRREATGLLDVGGAGVVRCGKRRLAVAEVEPGRLRVVDVDSGVWSRSWIAAGEVVEVMSARGRGGDRLVVVCRNGTSVFLPETLRTAPEGARPVPATGLRRPGRDGPPPPGRKAGVLVHHTPPGGMTVRHALLLPGGAEYAVAGGRDLAVVGVFGGEVLRRIELPSSCTGLAVGRPAGGLAVATVNGLIVFD
ncbi:caspase family protein [Streptomyces sp. ISL-99]|uniref:caspase family protein n=1 Tax=Streptomyces sp. ISL-99 TaxID=2819193 RepID=UPI001BE8EFC2|nr:caspase family protein [Streptomyces sp. ISL-99]MBT2526797.1 caspase family protein [Streptomyces sp. ISL-99]